MSEDMSLEDVAKVLNEHGHRKVFDWRRDGEHWIYSPSAGMGFNGIEARLIANGYVKPDAGPATKAVIDAIIYVRKCYRADRQLIVQCGGSKHVIPGDVVDAFITEHEAKS